jgi:Ca2+-binding EF-hand superfamily protein
MNKKDFLIVAATAILFPLGAYAAEGSSSAQDSFNQLDANQDGSINQQEAQGDQQLMDNWNQADANQDGQIDAAEFSAFYEAVEAAPSSEQPSGGESQQQ